MASPEGKGQYADFIAKSNRSLLEVGAWARLHGSHGGLFSQCPLLAVRLRGSGRVHERGSRLGDAPACRWCM